MKINHLLIAIIAFSTLSLSPAVFAAEAAATVNGKAIKQSWVDFITKDAQARGQKPSDGMKNAIINELVGSELAYQEAQKQGLDKDPDFKTSSELANRKMLVNVFLQDFMKKNPVQATRQLEASFPTPVLARAQPAGAYLGRVAGEVVSQQGV